MSEALSVTLTLCVSIHCRFFHLVLYNKLYTVYTEGSQVTIFKKTIVLISLKIIFALANSADQDEMVQYAAFHLGIHCLPHTGLGVSGPQRVNSEASCETANAQSL